MFNKHILVCALLTMYCTFSVATNTNDCLTQNILLLGMVPSSVHFFIHSFTFSSCFIMHGHSHTRSRVCLWKIGCKMGEFTSRSIVSSNTPCTLLVTIWWENTRNPKGNSCKQSENMLNTAQTLNWV